jgi:hypothetical protein
MSPALSDSRMPAAVVARYPSWQVDKTWLGRIKSPCFRFKVEQEHRDRAWHVSLQPLSTTADIDKLQRSDCRVRHICSQRRIETLVRSMPS